MPYKNCENCAYVVRLQEPNYGMFCQRYGMVTHALCGHWKQQITTKTTNADHIRNMSDEELALQLYLLRLDALRLEGFDGFIETKDEILEWLKEEVEE